MSSPEWHDSIIVPVTAQGSAVQPPNPSDPPEPPDPLPQPPARSGNRLLIIGFAAGAALIIAIAVVIVVLTSRGGSDGPVKASLQMVKVLAETPAACPAGETRRLTSVDGDACYTLGDGMMVTELTTIKLHRPDPAHAQSQFGIDLTLRPEDARHFATLTGQVAGQTPPRNKIAIVVGKWVVSAPEVQQSITGGEVLITGDFTQAKAQKYIDLMTQR
jgi:hypothetical protein